MAIDPTPNLARQYGMIDLLTSVRGFGEQRPVRTLPPPTIEVAPLVPGRVAAVATIDRMSFGSPWSEADFHRATAQFGRYGVVALNGPHSRVVGFAIVELDDEERTATVTRFASDENFRRRAVMRRLFERIAADAAYTGHTTLEVPIPETDASTRRFLQAIGFRGVRVARGFYGDVDAFVLAKPVGSEVCQGK
jgi:ribosomal-protein-alanine N-acetyltransferase